MEWVRREMYRDMNRDVFYLQHLPLVLGNDSENQRNTVEAIPHFAGDRTSFRQLSASFSRMSLGTTRDDYAAPKILDTY